MDISRPHHEQGHRAGFYGSTEIGFNITRADIATFTTAMLTDTTYIGAAPAISN